MPLRLATARVAETAVRIGEAKVALGFGQAFFRGDSLQRPGLPHGMASAFAAHDVAGKVLAIVFPISAFVALGFEHSIANMYLIPIAWLAGASTSIRQRTGRRIGDER